VIGSIISGVIFSNIPFYWYSIIMSIILIFATIFLFFLKLPHIAESNFLRERTDSVIVSALPKRHEMVGDSHSTEVAI
jgi:hypothetical protein